jgi:hypothetical protein
LASTPRSPDEPFAFTAAMFDPAQIRPLPGASFREVLEKALAAVRLAQERPIHSMIAYVQKQGAPTNHAIRLIVTELLDIFEKATGIEPKVNYSQHAK